MKYLYNYSVSKMDQYKLQIILYISDFIYSVLKYSKFYLYKKIKGEIYIFTYFIYRYLHMFIPVINIQDELEMKIV